MALDTGTRLGVYEVVGPLGAGGMGEVYRAADTKLGRQVALKVLPSVVSEDSGRLARFEREAQLLASLNHPNIAALYGLEESGPALVMELVEGETLAERMARGRVAVDEAIAIARQVCDALEAAHAKGVVHRDLKPANIKITPEGQVKVLDFGLAKALEGEEAATAASTTLSPTLTIAATRAGVILGTAAYMSPEQARGIPADKRADIWAFGVVLFEMLTGRSTFGGETVSDTLAAVLRADIDFALLPADTPSPVRRLLRRCLERDRRKRLHDIADARIEFDAPDEVPPAAAIPERRLSRLPWAAALALPIAAGAGWWLHRPPAPDPLSVEFQLAPPEGLEFTPNQGFALSPDGRHLAVAARRGRSETSLWIRDLHSSRYRELNGTEQGWSPFWSPDGRSLAFFASGKLKRIDAAGGAIQTLCDALGSRGGAWGADGVILFGTARSALLRVPAAGGKPVNATRLGPDSEETAHVFPHFLPDGKRFLFVSRGKKPSLFLADLEGRNAPRLVLETDSPAVYAGGADGLGRLLFRREGVLMAVPFDLRRAAAAGEPYPVIDRIRESSVGSLNAAVSPSGRVLLADATNTDDPNELAVFDRAGRKLSVLSPVGQPSWGHIELSHDGKRLLGDRYSPGASEEDIWTLDLERGVTTRLTLDPGRDAAPVWSPDGRRVYYSSEHSAPGIRAVPADGSGKPQAVLAGQFHHLAVSPDGRTLVFERGSAGAAPQIGALELDKPGAKPEVLIEAAAGLGHPQFSFDGRWLAFASYESGRSQIYVQSHPPGSGRWQVSRDGGYQARWRRDGRELIFVDASGAFYSVSVQPRAGALEFGAPVRLFERDFSGAARSRYFAMSADAQRFYISLPGPRAAPPPLIVMVDWQAALKR